MNTPCTFRMFMYMAIVHCHAITFTSGILSRGRVWTALFSHIWVKSYHYFDLVWFDGISTRVCYLMPNSVCTYKSNIIIIIKSCHYHGYPWPSLASSPNRSSPPAGLQHYIPYPHMSAVYMFQLVVLLLLGHMWGSIGVHHLWARLCFSRSVLRVWFV